MAPLVSYCNYHHVLGNSYQSCADLFVLLTSRWHGHTNILHTLGCRSWLKFLRESDPNFSMEQQGKEQQQKQSINLPLYINTHVYNGYTFSLLIY